MKKGAFLLVLNLILVPILMTPGSAMLPNEEDTPDPVRPIYFRPEEAPTPRLQTWVSFWDSEVALQMRQHWPAILYPATAQQFAYQCNRLTHILEGDNDAPLTIAEATFLLSHKTPIE